MQLINIGTCVRILPPLAFHILDILYSCYGYTMNNVNVASKKLIIRFYNLDYNYLLNNISFGYKYGMHAMIRVNFSLEMTQQRSLNSNLALVVENSNRNTG